MKEVEVVDPVVANSTGVSNPLVLIQSAIDRGIPIEQLGKLLDLQERWEKNQARNAFYAAMTEFKKNPPEINKNKQVSYTTDKGTTSYMHATLDEVSLAIAHGLSEHGLAHRWENHQLDGGVIEITCILSHALGHSERTTMRASPDSSGGKNGIQAIGSTITYLERYTLLAATGMAAKGQDDDGRLGSAPALIDENERAYLKQLLIETNSDRALFLHWLLAKPVENMSEDESNFLTITKEQYAKAVDMLKRKAQKAKKEGAKK